MAEKVAILGGTGKMGRWFARFFKTKGYRVVIGGRSPQKNRIIAEELGVESASSNSDAVRGASIVVVSTSIETVPETIMKIKDSIGRGSIVFDIASVKTGISEALEVLHAKGARVTSIHPMFGPGADSIKGKKIIVVPVVKDDTATAWVVDFFQKEGADVHMVKNAEEHDRIVAITLSLTHFLNISLGRVLARQDIQKVKELAGTTFSLQLTLAEAVLSEDPELYYGIESLNPFFKELAVDLMSAMKETYMDLDSKEAFVKHFIESREGLAKDSQFSTAYERFYRALKSLT
jgi:prephenate dehydrogenase